MNYTEHHELTEKAIQEKVAKKLTGTKFTIENNVVWRKGSEFYEFDIVIKRNDMFLAVVEIKTNLKMFHNQAKRQIERSFAVLPFKYGIITDGLDSYLCTKDSPQKWRNINIERIIDILESDTDAPIDEIQNNYDENLDKIKKVLNNYGITPDKIKTKPGEKAHLDSEDECIFWKNLLAKKDIRTIYRYTSLDTVFSMLKNGTFRMNGIVAMNDKSEIDYFNDYCGDAEPRYEVLNNLFLSSCSSLEDNLTMWRLYADDAKGACLVININNDVKNDNFLLEYVSYAGDNGKDKGLDDIKDLLMNGFNLKDIDRWKHFFKPKDYSIEKEIRLLFQYDKSIKYDEVNGEKITKDWCKTSDHSIINPYIDITLNHTSFCLELSEIILGPKCPESETNIKQIKEMIKDKNLNIDVNKSKIVNYR